MPSFRIQRAVLACAVAGAFSVFAAGPVFADDAQDVSKLIKAGQYDQAMVKVDAALTVKPRDAQLRFMRGLIFTEQGKVNDAISVFVRLTEDYPELPEPYNNLAVLYASQGQYEKARAALEMAIRTHPAYATAHENLGDVYAKLASQAYDKALQLDSTNTAAQTKLALIHELFSPNADPKKVALAPHVATPTLGTRIPTAAPTATPVMPVTPPPVAAAAPVAPTAVAKPTFSAPPAPAPVAPTPAPAPVKPVVAAPAPVAAPAAAPTPAPAPAPVAVKAAASPEDAEVSAAVQAWASAWAAKDVSAYLGSYAPDFATPGGVTRSAWEEDRRARIVGKSSISVKIENLVVAADGAHATAHFRQDYHADHLVANSRKTLVLEKAGGKWLIQKETTGG